MTKIAVLRQLVGLAEAAESLGVQPITMRKAAETGSIDAVKVGPTWVTTRDEVERYRRENLGQFRGGRRPKGT